MNNISKAQLPVAVLGGGTDWTGRSGALDR